MRKMALALLLTVLPLQAAYAEVGQRFPSEKREIVDPVTKATLTLLTNNPGGDSKIYQTHPQWTSDGRHIIFRSSKRAADGSGQAFAVEQATGTIIQLTEGAGVNIGTLNVARRSNKLYYLRAQDGRTRLIELDLDKLFADSAAGKVTKGRYEREVALLPAEYRDSGGFTLDADEKTAYLGVVLEEPPPRPQGGPVPQVPSGIRAVDLKTGEYRKVIDVPFRMGHVQASPFVPGEIIYCQETGGDAPQRMHVVKADGTGNRPLFPETPTDWVTHEVVVDADHVMFNLMGHTPELRQRPTGIMVVNLRDGSVQNLGQTEGRGFWHSDGTPDGRWAVGDDFDGNITLIDRKTGGRTLLSAGHYMRPDHTHPNFSPDGKHILIQSGMLSQGKKLDLMLVPIPATR